MAFYEDKKVFYKILRKKHWDFEDVTKKNFIFISPKLHSTPEKRFRITDYILEETEKSYILYYIK